MKRIHRKPPTDRRKQTKKRLQTKRRTTASRKPGRSRPKKSVRGQRRQRITDPRVARALGLMRRTGASASEAARRERMKLKTFRQGAGRYLYRFGPGKPWKARSEDQLALSMTVLTRKGRIDAIIRNSRERRLLHDYESAVRMFRADEDGAGEELKRFEGKTVAGHDLITDTRLLIELEEADELDYDNLYTTVGARP